MLQGFRFWLRPRCDGLRGGLMRRRCWGPLHQFASSCCSCLRLAVNGQTVTGKKRKEEDVLCQCPVEPTAIPICGGRTSRRHRRPLNKPRSQLAGLSAALPTWRSSLHEKRPHPASRPACRARRLKVSTLTLHPSSHHTIVSRLLYVCTAHNQKETRDRD